MLHFVTGVYNSLFSTPEYHVLIVGRECAGKSTLLEQLKFLYTPAMQQCEKEQRQAERQAAETASSAASNSNNKHDSPIEVSSTAAAGASLTRSPSQNVSGSSTTSSTSVPRPSLPPGTPLRATPAYMAQKRIRPTVGLNYAVVQHRFSPPVAVVNRVKKSQMHATTPVTSLPPPPAEILAEQRARQQALLANAPSDAVTRVVLRDLGGQTALRDLWEKYYTQTQALVYVVDSTLPFRSPSTATASRQQAVPQRQAAVGPPQDHFTGKALEELYKPDRKLLAKLLQHPLLEGVPVLLLSNKIDETPHLPLAKVQEAMRLTDLATDRAFYMQEHIAERTPASSDGLHEDRSALSETPLHSTKLSAPVSSSSPAAVGTHTTALSRHCNCAETAQRRVGESGFGEIALRIAEVSAMDGAGVAGAMDWLVAQLLFHSRSVNADA